MKKINDVVKKKYGNKTEKILQFGEGNFLRAFADWMIDGANERGDYDGSIVVCQPIGGNTFVADTINNQMGIYTVVMRGVEDGKVIEKRHPVTSISRCISAYKDYDKLMELARSKDLEVVISNTTEAGITYKEGDKLTDCPLSSFPAKVTAFLYERFKTFGNDKTKGLLFLPVELIDENGTNLKRIILQYAKDWELEDEFILWINDANKFTNTLVDRIVTGYPKDQVQYFDDMLGYKDDVIVTSELFNLWVIEGEKEWADILPIDKGEANVLWTNDVIPYKVRKVRILNGAHTSTVLAAYLAGHNIVSDFMNDEVFKKYLNTLLFEEVIPTLELPKDELEAFAKAVGERFSNPYIKHSLLDISLNSCSKFNTRCVPSLLSYYDKMKKVPDLLTFSLAAFIKFYDIDMKDGIYTGKRADGTPYLVKDDKEVLEFFNSVWKYKDSFKIAEAVLSKKEYWSGKDLSEIPGMTDAVAGYLKEMEEKPIEVIIAGLLEHALIEHAS